MIETQRLGILWLTGLSGSGKTTLAFALQKELLRLCINVIVLDGDELRKGLNQDLGFSRKDRKENIRRVTEVSRLFLEAKINVIVALVSPYREDRELAKERIGKEKFVEVAIDCPLEVCMERDPKKLYQNAKKGAVKEFTGITDPYEPALNPDISLQTHKEDVNTCVETIISYLSARHLIL